MLKQTTLDNGVVVLSERIPGASSAAAGIWVQHGSRDESSELRGLSHYYEHMVFKGTENRSALDIALQVEGKGAYLNAYTSKDYTCFYTRSSLQDLPGCFSVVGDMINAPVLDKVEAAREKQVIIEEIRGYDDTPDDAVHDLFAAALWGKSPLGQPVAGTVSSVRKLGNSQLRDYHQRVLQELPMIAVCAGDVQHKDFCRMVEKALPNKEACKPHSYFWNETHKTTLSRRRDIQQSHIVIGTALPPTIENRYTMAALNTMLGEGMASRLFQKVREEQGLAYSVYSSVDEFLGCRGFSVYAGADPDRASLALELIAHEMQILGREGFRADELEFARGYLLGSLRLSLDIPSSRMNRLARSLLLQGEIVPIREIEQRLVRLKLSAVNDFAMELLSRNWAGCCIIPKNSAGLSLKSSLNFAV